ncbi:cation diffusion facilitator family transporter [Fulvimonas sp. R45]|uniref:cation diffusion facilitator family transporter n=1 Tax=Fulvimonas sp. R45 TaxID=3045937 RepID=UPI00265DCC78|nr:cation diffusion facilitator family transporter [Fulvimonas sp. R45]MDO1527223.1 cation diffusion facilitator family transporter [Fulvimonas sp. R45]
MDARPDKGGRRRADIEGRRRRWIARRAARSRLVVYAALAENLLIAAAKLAAGLATGSAAILSEAVHSFVDTTNELLLLYGLHRANQPPDAEHPFGHGRELYFWSFIVALLVWALGAGMALVEGISQLRHPHSIEHPLVNYAVLAASAVFEGISWWIAVREFRTRKGEAGYLEALQQSKDPSVFSVLLEDSAALAGLAVAFVGLLAAQLLDMPRLDGVASIGVALVLAVFATVLARETKGLLIGEPAQEGVNESLVEVACRDPAVCHVNGVLTVQMGPHQVVAALSAEFDDTLTTPQIEACIHRLEQEAMARHPELSSLFVKPQSAELWRARRRAWASLS